MYFAMGRNLSQLVKSYNCMCIIKLKLLYYLDLWLVMLVKPWGRQRGPRPIQPTAQLGQHYWGRKERGSPKGGDHMKKTGGGVEWGVEDKCTDRQKDSRGNWYVFKGKVWRIWSFIWCKMTRKEGGDKTDGGKKNSNEQPNNRRSDSQRWTQGE